MKEKIKADIKIDVTGNGSLVRIRMRKKLVGSKVFEGPNYFKRQTKWIEEIIKKNQEVEIEKKKPWDWEHGVCKKCGVKIGNGRRRICDKCDVIVVN